MIWLPLAVLAVKLAGPQNGEHHTTRGTIAEVVGAIAIAPLFLAGLRLLLHDFLIGPARAWLTRRATNQPIYYSSRRRELYERRRPTQSVITEPEEQSRTD